MLSADGEAEAPEAAIARTSNNNGRKSVAPASESPEGTESWSVVATGPDAVQLLDLDGGSANSNGREFAVVADVGRSATLFKVEALAVLERARPDSEDPSKDSLLDEAISALSNSHSFSVVAGNDVHILSEDCSEHRATITFECPVDFAALSAKSRFAAIGDSSATLHFAHVASGSVVFSQDLSMVANVEEDSEEPAFQWIGFAQRQLDETETLLVVLASGTMLRFSNVDLLGLEEAFEKRDMTLATQIKEAISVETIKVNGDGGSVEQVKDVLYLPLGIKDERIILGGRGSPNLLVFRRSPLTNKTMLFDTISLPGLQDDRVVRFCVDRSTNAPTYFLILYASGRIAMCDSRSLAIVAVADAVPGAYDVQIISAGSAVVFAESSKEKSLLVLTLPGLQVHQKFALEGHCWTANVSLKPHETESRMQLCFLEETPCDQDSQRLVIRKVAEIAPRQRLAALVRAKRWEEAEDLAAEFPNDLDLAAVLKAKLQDQVSESLSDAPSCPDVQGMLEDLAQIPDLRFRVETCLVMLPRTLEDTYALLTYARDVCGTKEQGVELPVQDVHRSLKRLGTFQLISSTADGTFDFATWYSFRTSDLAAEMQELVAQGDLFRTIIIWRRHYLEDNLLLHMDDILSEMPEDVAPGTYLAWLRLEVLPLLNNAVQRSKAAYWIEKRARLVEQLERKPHTALEIIKLLDVEPVSAGSTHSGAHLEASGPPTPAMHVSKTIALAQASSWGNHGDDFIGKVVANGLKAQLIDLVNLWDTHDLKLSLAEYASETPQSIAIELLDRVAAPEMLKDAVDEHFKPYAQANDLSCDELLTEYAAEIMESAGSGSSLAGSPWEARVLALVGCMQSVETKIETVLEVMRRAPVPWSAELDSTISEALTWTTVRRIDELREQYRLMQLKKMLLRYDISSFNVSDLALATGLMRHILSRTDMVNVMPDALQVVSAYHHLNKLDAFAGRLRNLFSEELNSRALCLLHTGDEVAEGTTGTPAPKEHTLSIADQASICGEILEWALVTMEEAVTFQDVTEEKADKTYKIALNAAIDMCDNVIKCHLQGEPTSSLAPGARAVGGRAADWQKRLQEFFNMRSLVDDFGFIVLPTEYHDDILSVQNRLLSEMAREVFRYASGKGKEGEHSKPRRSYNDLYRLAELLGVPRDDLKGVMAEEAARCGDFRTVSLLCKEVIERGHDEKVGTTLRGVAARLTSYAAQHSQVFRDIKESLFSHRLTGDIKRLAQQAVSCCSADSLPDALDAFKVYEITHSVFNQCDAGDYGTLLDQIDEDEMEEDLYGSSSYAGGAGASGSSSSAAHWEPPVRARAALQLPDHEIQNVEDRYGKGLFEDHFYENGLVLDTESTMALAAQFAVTSLQPAAASGSGKRKSKSADARGPLANGRDLVDYLGRNQCRMLTMQVWQRLLEHLVRKNAEEQSPEDQVEELGQRGYFDLISTLLQTVLSTRHIDESLALGFMLCLPLEKAFDAYKAGMQTTGTEYHRLIKIATIGRAAGAAWRQRSFQLDCQQLGTNARWWQQLRLLEIPFDEAAFRTNRGGEYQRQLVVPLLQKTSFDILTVLEFSRAYNIEDDFVFLNYIQLLLQFDDGSSYAWKIAAVVDDVVNREKLQKLLIERCYPSISPYDYERLQFTFGQVRRLDEKEPVSKKALLILEILVGYQRLKSPSESELIEAKRAVDDSRYYASGETMATLLDRFPLAAKRLPLKPFLQDEGHFWPLLQDELSEETLPKLIPLSIPLGMSPDRFYETVIKSMASATKKAFDLAKSQERSESGPRVVDSASTLRLKFADFRPLLLKYREIGDALQMTAYTASVFPCGPDRIQAYKTALHLAEKWVQKLSSLDAKTEDELAQLDKATTAQTKIRHMLAATETEYQLRSLNLTSFLEYLQRPQDLIVQLYTQKSKDMMVQKDPMDLHSVIDDIGKRHGIDADKLRLKLIHHWLGQEVTVSKADKDAYLPSIRVQMNNVANSATEREMQLRLLYLLKSQPLEKSIHDLIQLALQPSSKVVNMMRIRTLSVLFQLATPEEISKQMSFDQLKNYLQTLLYLTDFEELRIPQTIKEFSSCDKEALVRSLWLNHNTESKALQLICNISIDFRLWDVALWENVLHRLLKNGTYPYLMGILEHISAVPELSQVKFLPKLWDNVVLGSLESLRTSTETDKATSYLNVVQLIQKCPFLPQLSMTAIADQFANVTLADPVPKNLLISLRTLSAMPSSADVVQATDKVCSAVSEETLRKSLELLDKATVRADSTHDFDYYNDIMKGLLFDTIDQRRAYDSLLKTPYLMPFISYLIDSGKGHNMIVAALKKGKHAEACELVVRVYAKHGGVPDLTKDEMLKQYLEESAELLDEGDRDFISRVVL